MASYKSRFFIFMATARVASYNAMHKDYFYLTSMLWPWTLHFAFISTYLRTQHNAVTAVLDACVAAPSYRRTYLQKIKAGLANLKAKHAELKKKV